MRTLSPTTMPANLDIATLRSFLLIAQGRKFSEAALAAGRSQSAITLQIQKLESDVCASVFRRTGNGVELTPVGERLLGYAHRLVKINDESLGQANRPAPDKLISLGITPDFAETVMPPLLIEFNESHPEMTVILRIDRTPALINAVLSGEIDLAIGEHKDDPLNQGIIAEAPLIWVGRKDFRMPSDALLPLAMIEGNCTYSAAAVEALRGRQQFRVAATAKGPGEIIAAVRSGFSVTVRTRHALRSPLISIGEELNLPALPTLAFALYAQPSENSPVVTRLIELWREHVAA